MSEKIDKSFQNMVNLFPKDQIIEILTESLNELTKFNLVKSFGLKKPNQRITDFVCYDCGEHVNENDFPYHDPDHSLGAFKE